jgi:hypothetical protein
MAGVVFLLDLLFGIQVVFFGDGTWLVQFGLIAVSATFSWLCFIRPEILIYDEGITVVNPFITATVGWDAVESIETKYAFTIETSGARVVAWAAPAPGRYHNRNLHASELKGISYDKDFGLRPGDSPKSQSGAAAHVARTRLANFRKAKNATAVKRGGKLNRTGLALMCVSLALVALGYILHG